MSKSYHEIMDKIEVTDEMRSRILARTAARLGENRPEQLTGESWPEGNRSETRQPEGNRPETRQPEESRPGQGRAGILLLRRWRTIAPVAACFVVLIAGSALLKKTTFPGITATEGTVDQMIHRVVECDSLEELAAHAGFAVPKPENLPFEADEIRYTWQWGTIAQIDYSAGENTVCFRKAAGEDDISGDYTEYELVRDVTVRGTSVTIREEGGYCYLATWQKDGYTYAVSLMPGIEWSKLLLLLESVL